MTHTGKRRIQHKRSSVPGAMPSPSALKAGEMAINFPDRTLYALSDAGQIVKLNGHTTVGLTANPAEEGDTYIDPATGKFYSYYTLSGAGGPTWNEIAPPENLALYLALVGGAMQGPLVVTAPAVDDELVGFEQASDMIAESLNGYVRLDGSTAMEDLLQLAGAPVAATDAATKKYVDDKMAAAIPDTSEYLLRIGGTMTGQIVLPGGSTGNQAVTFNEQSAAFISHDAQADPHSPYANDTDLTAHKTAGADEHPLVTPSVNGFMSAADKTRFDALQKATDAEVDAGVNGVKYTTSYDLKRRITDVVPTYSRPLLSANLTLYVRDNGNDANNGLTDTSTGAFKTWQAAINKVCTYDVNGKVVTIKCTQGASSTVTFTQGATIPKMVGVTRPGNFILQGQTANPDHVKIVTTENYGFRVDGGMARVEGFIFDVDAAAGDCAALSAVNGGVLEQQSNHFNSQVLRSGYISAHLLAEFEGAIYTIGNYRIRGDVQYHMLARWRGYITAIAHSFDFDGTVDFTAFARCRMNSMINYRANIDWEAAGVGSQYQVTSRSVIANGSGNADFPGTTAGDASTGGLYTT